MSTATNAAAAAIVEVTTMVDPAVYLEKLSAFSRMLRLAGLPVSPKETADACEILIELGFADRQLVKTALRTVFAKSREEQHTFDRTFDSFFLSEAAMKAQATEEALEQRRMEMARQQAMEELQLNGQPMDFTDDQREAYASLPDRDKERLLNFKNRFRDNAERNPELYSNFIHSVFAKTILEQQLKLEDAGIGCADMDPDMGLLFRDISQFQDTEIPKAVAVIQKITQQINAELSFKRRNRGHSGQLDFRRTIRKGLETGGSFYKLKYKKKRQHKRHLVLLCDVSGSMVQFSEFVLRFILSMNNVSDSSRCFLFSEEMCEADAFNLQNMDSFREYVRDTGIFGRGTNLGKALIELCKMKPAALNDSTTLLILSDAQTVDRETAVYALLEAKRQAGQVLWLNPLAENHWKHQKSAQIMSSICTMVSCNTLNALSNACKRLIQH
ncbi:MAG: VWA domain-containing protein [Oscillospiraceae bacterium]|nr:VWA domain-containing protein [Oscillospiraceae bacterium]